MPISRRQRPIRAADFLEPIHVKNANIGPIYWLITNLQLLAMNGMALRFLISNLGPPVRLDWQSEVE